MNIFTRYLNSTAVFSPPDEKSAADKERDAIQVTSSVKDNDENENNENDNTNKEKDENNENDDGDENDEDEEENKIDDDDGEKTEEEKKKIIEEKEAKRQARVQKRIDKFKAQAAAANSRVQELEKQIAEQPKEGLTEEEVERRAEEKAKKKLEEKLAKDNQKAFEKSCDILEAEAIKVDKTFNKKVGEMVEEIGPVPVPLINILADLDNNNGGEVLNFLTDNIDEAEEIYELPERKMTQRLIRISDKLKEQKKLSGKKQRSNNPDPITPITESHTADNIVLTGKEDQETFNRLRAKQVEARQKARGY